jgi:predicted dehydrogenase
VIGYGLGGRVFHAPYISAVDGLKLAAIVSSRKDEIAKAYPHVPVLSDPEAVFADPAIDVVVISTPNDSHASLATRALEAGKHVVIDKPFAQTADEARLLMQKAKGRILTVFHNRRWDSDFLTLKQLIADDALGEVAYVESHFDLYRPTVSQRWREQPGPSSGAWYDLGAHLLDQALNLFGMPLALAADLDVLRPGGVTTDYFRVCLKYQKLRIVLVGNYLAQSDLRWIVHGSKASYIKYGLDPQQGSLVAGGAITDANFGIDSRPGHLVLPGGNEIVPPTLAGDYRAFYSGLRDCLRGVGPVPVRAGEALAVMELLALAEKSSRERRFCTVPDDG